MLVELVNELGLAEPGADGDEFVLRRETLVESPDSARQVSRSFVPTDFRKYFLNKTIGVVRHCHCSNILKLK